MLVLRRRSGESFCIGDEIEIEVLELTSTRVKLGIVAPDHVPVVRKEVQLTIQQNRRASQAVDPQSISWLAGKLADLDAAGVDAVNGLTPSTRTPAESLSQRNPSTR